MSLSLLLKTEAAKEQEIRDCFDAGAKITTSTSKNRKVHYSKYFTNDAK